jgi:hypothetical protein
MPWMAMPSAVPGMGSPKTTMPPAMPAMFAAVPSRPSLVAGRCAGGQRIEGKRRGRPWKRAGAPGWLGVSYPRQS